MDKYLLHILHEVNTIIIPGLGALTVTNKTTGEIMFMSYLKHDDGKLAKHIAEKENMAENDAKNLIAKYVRDITAKLDTGDTYDMYQFGRFVKKNGELDFEHWNSYQHDTSEEVKEEVKQEDVPEAPVVDLSIEQAGEKIEEVIPPTPEIKEEKVEANEVIAEELKTSLSEEASLDEILNKEEKKEEIPEAKIDASKIEPAEENVYIPQEEIKEIVAKQQAEKPLLKAKKELKKEVKKPPLPKAEKEKTKRKVSPLLIILIVVLLLGGTSTFIFFDKIKATFFASSTTKTEEVVKKEPTDENLEEIEKQVELENEQKAEEEANQNSEAVEEQKTEESAPEKTPEIKTPNSNISGDSPYHIIAGSFGMEENANRMAKKLQDEGKDSKVLGKFDDMYMVSYASFASQAEASEALKSSGVKGWIFKYPK